ncbi:MAG: MFS transporter [Verrucomicrobiota bacterium]
MNTPNPSSQSQETLLQQMRAMPRVVWILSAGLFVHRFGTFVVPFLTLYLKDSGYTVEETALIFGAMAAGGVGAMALGGRLSDLIGRRNTMGLSLFGGAISMILMWQADGLVLYLLSAFLVGITHGMYHPASNSLLIDVVPQDRHITAFAIIRWAVNLGFACGMAAGGLLAEKNYAYLFVGDAVTSVLFAVIAVTMLPHGVRTSKEQSQWARALKDMIRNRAFMIFFCANFLAIGTFFQWGSSVARLIQDLGYNKSVYGWLMAGNGLMIAFLEIPLSQLARRRNPTRVIALGFLLCGLGVSINGFAGGVPGAWIIIALALLVFTFGEMISMPVSGAYVASLSPTEMRGRYSAAVGLTWNLGHAVAPGLGLILYERFPSLLWWGCLAVGLLSAGLMLVKVSSVKPCFDS